MLKPVYALVGRDLFLQLDALARLMREASADTARIDLDGDNAQLSDVLDELRTFSMFAGAKLVVVRNADDFVSRYREPLEGYLSNSSGASGTLVLRLDSLPANQRIYKLIAKAGQVVDCKPPKDLVGWVIDRGKKAHRVTVPRDAAQTLVELIGDDLGRLDNELAKLAISAVDARIDAKSIAGNVSFQREQEMWTLTNDLSAGRSAQAVERWRQLIQTDPSTEFRAITWLTIWLEKVRKALSMQRAGINRTQIASDLKIWPRDAQSAFFDTATTLGEQGAGQLIELLAEVDYQSKSGVGDMATNVERFLLTVAAGQQRR